MKRLEANARRAKSEVHHKNKVKNSNYKVVVKDGQASKK